MNGMAIPFMQPHKKHPFLHDLFNVQSKILRIVFQIVLWVLDTPVISTTKVYHILTTISIHTP